MSDEIRINRPQQPAMQPQNMAMKNDSMMQNEMPMQKNSKAPWIILGLVIVVIVILGVIFRGQLFKGGEAMTATKASGYQAVFLSNGQVYFGKISNPNSDYVTLDDIYYLQVGPQQGSNTGASASATPSQNISLVKLGNELHGPVDEMHISRSQILFYEDLKTDGQVVSAILKDKAAAAATPAPAAGK